MLLETWYDQDLKQPVRINRLPGCLFAGDIEGNEIGVRITSDGEPITFTGLETVVGYIIRPDGETVTITDGTTSGNEASIVLSEDCYAIPGNVRITIKIDDVTVLACTGVVKLTATEDTL